MNEKTLIYRFENELSIAEIIKRPSAKCKTPYVADIRIIKENNEYEDETMGHTPALGCCGLTDKKSIVCVSKKINPKKCSHTVELSILKERDHDIVIGCNPKMAENLFEYCLRMNLIENLSHVEEYKREKTFLNSRFDFWGRDKNNCEFICEIKNVPLAVYEDIPEKEYKKKDYSDRNVNTKIAYFPDGYRKKKNDVVSPRALKHIEELEIIKLEKGNNIRCIISFVIQRNDINSFQASNLDPIYKKAFKKAINNGVEVIPIIVEWTKTGEAYFINRDIPVFL